MPDAAFDSAVRIFTREFLGIGTGIWMRRAVGITLQRNGGYGDRRECGESLVNLVINRLAIGQAKPPAGVIDNEAKVIPVF